MDDFDEMFTSVSIKQILQFLTGKRQTGINLGEITKTSIELLKFDTNDIELLSNKAFIQSWGIARVKAEENLKLIKALLLLKRKYKISDLDFELILEEFDEEKII